MAKKRMFSLEIVDTDAFLDMPQSSQLLYFHLAMRADDEGFVSSPKRIMKMIGSGEDDLRVLMAKKFIIGFESGVCVIKHWLIHNTIRMDRFGGTTYIKEKAQLVVKDNKAYKLVGIPEHEEPLQIRQPNGNQLATQVKLSKDKLSKDKEKGDLSPTLSELLNSLVQGTHPLKEEFLSYWTEKNAGGKKERWQMEKVFDVKRRWNTWLKNEAKFNKTRKSNPPEPIGWVSKPQISNISPEQRAKNLERIRQMKASAGLSD